MMNCELETHKVIDKVNQVRDLAQDERFDEALKLIGEIEKTTHLPPNLLVLKGICIVLADTGKEPTEAEYAFREALAVDDEYVEALNELGNYYLTIKEDPAKAMPLFEKALDVAESQVTESVMGLAISLLHTAGRDRALQFLRDVRKGHIDMERIEELEQELKKAK